jgi:hypothetical protein
MLWNRNKMADSDTFQSSVFSGQRAILVRPEMLRIAIAAAMDPRVIEAPEEVKAEIDANLGRLGITPDEWQRILQQSFRAPYTE